MVRVKNPAPKRHKDFAPKKQDTPSSEKTVTASSSSKWSTVSSASKDNYVPAAPANVLHMIPASFEEFEAQFKDNLRNKFKEIESTIKRLMQHPEIGRLMSTPPGPSDKTKRFETSYEVERELINTLGICAGALQKALAPTEILRFNHQAAMIHQARLPMKEVVNDNEAKIQEEIQKLYTQAKDVAIRNNIPLEDIQTLYENEDYEMMDKLISKDARCKNGIVVNKENGVITCVRVRPKRERKQDGKGCSTKRKANCNAPQCEWITGKRCYQAKKDAPEL